MSVKIVVTNMQALTAKYGAGVGTIQAALTPLIAADRARGIVTTIVDLSDKAQMDLLNAPPVTNASSAQQNKISIDAVYNNTNPNYLLILGAPDVIPHQPLQNPTGDSDPNVPSDLPYACSAPYSLQPGSFTGPTRVIGRLPDVAGSSDPSYLPRLIQFVIGTRPQPRQSYLSYFGLSTLAWQGSTELSLTNTFGDCAELFVSPPSGPTWRAAALAPLSHFVNCHGASNRPTWYGDDGAGSQPPAITAAALLQRVTPGAIVAAECCYGAQLYAPSAPAALSICNTYLLSGALSFYGSTNIAYGPPTGNAKADLITQYMLIAMLAGNSSGAAALSACQRFIAQSGPNLNPISLKTAVQFILLGDPSLVPVKMTPSPAAEDLEADQVSDVELEEQRRRAELMGRFLERNVAVPEAIDDSERTPEIDAQLREEARRRGLHEPFAITSYRSAWKGDEELLAVLGELPRFHVLLARRDPALQEPAGVALTAREEGGRIVSISETWQR